MPTLVAGSRLPVGSSASRIAGPVHEGAGDGDALLLTAGQLVREPPLLARQADEVEHLRHGVGDRVPRLADHLQRERDVLEHRLVRQQAEVLEDHADLAAQLRHLPVGEAPHVLAGDVHHPAGGPLLPQHQAQEGGLAGPGCAHEEDELALDDLEAHVVHRGTDRALVDLGDVLEADHTLVLVARAGVGRLPVGAPRASHQTAPASQESRRRAEVPRTSATRPGRKPLAPPGRSPHAGRCRPGPSSWRPSSRIPGLAAVDPVGEEVARWRPTPVQPRVSAPRSSPPPTLRPRGPPVGPARSVLPARPDDHFDHFAELTPRRRASRRGGRRFDDDEPRAARSRRPAPDLEGPDPAGPGERSEDVPYSTWLGALHGPTPGRTGW